MTTTYENMKTDMEKVITNLFEDKYISLQNDLSLLRNSYKELLKVNKQLISDNQVLRRSKLPQPSAQSVSLPPPQPSKKHLTT